MWNRRRFLAACCLAGTACRRREPTLAVGVPSARRAVLLEIISRHVERRLGGSVRRVTEVGEPLLAHERLVSGTLDVYSEDSGAALLAVLKDPPDPRPEVVRERVRLEYRNRYRLEWLDPLGFEDGFVLVALETYARAHGLQTLSDAERSQLAWSLAVPGDFLTQPEGMPALMKGYSLRMQTGPAPMAPGAVYQALRDGKATLAAGRMADGELLAPDLRVLADDRRAFPPAEVSLVVRQQALAARRGLLEALSELVGRIGTQQMRALNGRVLEGAAPAAVAERFLQDLAKRRQPGLRSSHLRTMKA